MTMSRINEILERIEISNKFSIEKSPVSIEEPLSIWPRFRKVREAIKTSFSQKAPVGIKRYFRSFSWPGDDSGIHDHTGRVEGEVNDIKLDFSIKGVTADNTKYVTGPNGEWKLQHNKNQDFKIKGNFISEDGRNGAFEFILQNKKSIIEGYWLQISGGLLRLEQVVNPEGQIYDANKLESYRRDWVIVPGTRHDLWRFLQS